jgi:hypothetical protein
VKGAQDNRALRYDNRENAAAGALLIVTYGAHLHKKKAGTSPASAISLYPVAISAIDRLVFKSP